MTDAGDDQREIEARARDRDRDTSGPGEGPGGRVPRRCEAAGRLESAAHRGGAWPRSRRLGGGTPACPWGMVERRGRGPRRGEKLESTGKTETAPACSVFKFLCEKKAARPCVLRYFWGRRVQSVHGPGQTQVVFVRDGLDSSTVKQSGRPRQGPGVTGTVESGRPGRRRAGRSVPTGKNSEPRSSRVRVTTSLRDFVPLREERYRSVRVDSDSGLTRRPPAGPDSATPSHLAGADHLSVWSDPAASDRAGDSERMTAEWLRPRIVGGGHMRNRKKAVNFVLLTICFSPTRWLLPW